MSERQRADLAEAAAGRTRAEEREKEGGRQLEEAHAQLQSNQQVIQWLNREVTDAQLGRVSSATSSAALSAASSYRPAASSLAAASKTAYANAYPGAAYAPGAPANAGLRSQPGAYGGTLGGTDRWAPPKPNPAAGAAQGRAGSQLTSLPFAKYSAPSAGEAYSNNNSNSVSGARQSEATMAGGFTSLLSTPAQASGARGSAYWASGNAPSSGGRYTGGYAPGGYGSSEKGNGYGYSPEAVGLFAASPGLAHTTGATPLFPPAHTLPTPGGAAEPEHAAASSYSTPSAAKGGQAGRTGESGGKAFAHGVGEAAGEAADRDGASTSYFAHSRSASQPQPAVSRSEQPRAQQPLAFNSGAMDAALAPLLQPFADSDSFASTGGQHLEPPLDGRAVTGNSAGNRAGNSAGNTARASALADRPHRTPSAYAAPSSFSALGSGAEQQRMPWETGPHPVHAA
mmetsp:Transcript_4543/g.11447  ORF Transcript_4543/g.11447 Transcript_4543/m.11447 type:complete len:456 (-) Transcript_4543:309-1676(-)